MPKWPRTFSRSKLLVLFGIGAALTGGVAYGSHSATAVTGHTRDALVETHVSHDLSHTGGQKVTIISFRLPAGAWVISSQATLVNFGPSDFTRCQIRAAGAQIASGTTMVGDPTLPGAQGPAAIVVGRGLLGSVRSSSRFTVSLRCWHDTSTPAGQPAAYVDPGAVIWARKSPSLSGTTS